jgi:soluble lytic murein transglycosylase-like protein
MKTIKNKKGFKVFMALMGIFSIYGGLFFYGNQATIPAPKTAKRTTRTAKGKKDNGLNKYHSIILTAARKHNVPPALVAAIMHAESNFNPRAISPVGARGLMQINGITQRHLGVRNVFDPKQNINGGTKYLRELLSTFRGNTRMAVAAYNAGPGAVRKFRGIPPYRETRKYVVKVLKLYSTYRRILPTSVMS